MELDPPCFPDPPGVPPADLEGDPDWRPFRDEDVWHQLERLLPSPPASPAEEEEEEEGGEEAEGGPERGWGVRRGGPNLSAFVLRDCMWSAGFSRERRLLLGAGGKGPRGNPPPAPYDDAPHEPALAGLCVAPAAVFAWPRPAPGGPARSPSDSSEGEEIDVVTVEKRRSRSVRKPVTITVRADPWDPCMKHFHISIQQQQHNYAARSPPEASTGEVVLEKSAPEEEEEDEDEDKDDAATPRDNGGSRCPGQVPESSSSDSFLLNLGSAPSSDSEDASKRRNHNYLERKRRNDLRSRFLALRDQVPGLAACPKPPKVVVLSRASEYLRSLLHAEREMLAEKKLLRVHQLQLLKRISLLKGVR